VPSPHLLDREARLCAGHRVSLLQPLGRERLADHDFEKLVPEHLATSTRQSLFDLGPALELAPFRLTGQQPAVDHPREKRIVDQFERQSAVLFRQLRLHRLELGA